MPGVAPGLLLCVSSVLGTYWGADREALAPASERLLCSIMLTPTPAPPWAASLTNECTQTSFTPRPPEEEKVFALHPGGWGGEDSHR